MLLTPLKQNAVAEEGVQQQQQPVVNAASSLPVYPDMFDSTGKVYELNFLRPIKDNVGSFYGRAVVHRV